MVRATCLVIRLVQSREETSSGKPNSSPFHKLWEDYYKDNTKTSQHCMERKEEVMGIHIERREGMTGCREKTFHQDCQEVPQIAQIGCAVSSLGGFPDQLDKIFHSLAWFHSWPHFKQDVELDETLRFLSNGIILWF